MALACASKSAAVKLKPCFFPASIMLSRNEDLTEVKSDGSFANCLRKFFAFSCDIVNLLNANCYDVREDFTDNTHCQHLFKASFQQIFSEYFRVRVADGRGGGT